MSIKGKWRRTLAPLVAAVLIISTGCSLLPREEPSLAPPLVQPVKQNYTTVEVKRGTIQRDVKGIALLEATDIAYHQFKEGGGRVKEVFVKAGDTVRKGDVLVQLELEGLDLDFKFRQLELEKAKLALEQAKGPDNEQLLRIRLMELDIAETQLELVRKKLNSKQIVAEADGQVIFVADVKPPDYIEPYRVLVSVADPHKLRLSYERSSTGSMNDVEVGMTAEATWKGNKFNATVTQTPNSAPLTDDQMLREKYARTLYLELQEVPAEAKLGEMVDIRIVTRESKDTLIIPKNALRSFQQRNYVQVLDGERLSELDVEVGIEAALEVEILAGVEEGQRIVLP